jgi:hypothetical protein
MWFHLSEFFRVVKFIKTENRKMSARGWGEKGKLLLNGYRVSGLQDERLR